MITYNIGLIITVIMFLVHGVVQDPSNALSASMSGIAVIGHILLGIGIVLLIQSLRTAASKES